MKFISSVVCLLLLSLETWGCFCGAPPPLTADILKTYPYVALVRVVSLERFIIPGEASQRVDRVGKFTFDIVENFKGRLPTELLMDSYKTSCDFGLRPEQTWLIFAKDYKGYFNVNACDYSIRYDTLSLTSTGLRFRLAEELLNTVRQLTGRPIQSKNGRLERFYANGQRALLTTYGQNGEEERTVWYQNGRLRGKEFYRKGLKSGPAVWWNANGTLNSTERFENGIAVDTSRHWQTTDTYLDSALAQVPFTLTNHALDSLLQVAQPAGLQSVDVMDRQGRLLLSQRFNQRGQIYSETVGVPDTGLEWSTAYNERGQINFLIVTRFSGTGHNQVRWLLYRIDYEQDGSRQVAYYDQKQRLTRWTKVKDGKETVLEQNHYKD